MSDTTTGKEPVRPRLRWVAVQIPGWDKDDNKTDGKWHVGIAEMLGANTWDGNPYAVVACISVNYPVNGESEESIAKRIAQALTYMEIVRP